MTDRINITDELFIIKITLGGAVVVMSVVVVGCIRRVIGDVDGDGGGWGILSPCLCVPSIGLVSGIKMIFFLLFNYVKVPRQPSQVWNVIYCSIVA